jgi:hypothetical protein
MGRAPQGLAIWDIEGGAPWDRSPVATGDASIPNTDGAGLVPDGFAWGRDGWYAAWRADGASTAGQAGEAGAGGGANAPVTIAAFSPDGRYVAWGAADDSTFVFTMESTDAPQGASKVLSSNVGAITGLAFASDTRLLITAGTEAAEVWTVRPGQLFLRIEADAAIQRVAVMPGDDRVLVVTEQDATVHLLDPDDQIELARDRVTRSLTDAECREYLHLDACWAS